MLKALTPLKTNKLWTDEEHEAFTEAAVKYGKNYSRIQKEVGTNSKQQQDASKVSIQETNTDLIIEEGSIMSSIERDYSSSNLSLPFLL